MQNLLREIFIFAFSARSKVRGQLDLYHAYIQDQNATSETDWEIIESNNSISSVRRAYSAYLHFKDVANVE